MNWDQSTARIGPSAIAPLPCRRCGQAAKVPIPSDALRGGPIVPRERQNPEYKEPLAFGNEANQMNTARPSIPLGNSTGVIEERSGLGATNASASKEEAHYPPPPNLIRLGGTQVSSIPPSPRASSRLIPPPPSASSPPAPPPMPSSRLEV